MTTKKLSVPLSTESYEALGTLTKNEGITKAAYVRKLIEKSIGTYNPGKIKEPKNSIRITISSTKLQNIKARADKCNMSVSEYISGIVSGDLPDTVNVTVNDLYFMAIRLSELSETITTTCKKLNSLSVFDTTMPGNNTLVASASAIKDLTSPIKANVPAKITHTIQELQTTLTEINTLFKTGFKTELSDRNRVCKEVKKEILRKVFKKQNASTKS